MNNGFRIKGFDKDLCCQGMQFEIGKEYNTGANPNDLKLCGDTVYHYGKSLQQVNAFYDCNTEINRYCIIEVLGNEISDNSKCGSNHIKIVREVVGEELSVLKGLVNGNTGLFNTGHYNTGDHNTGGCNTGHYNTGDHNTGGCNTGDHNTGHYNTGGCNTGYCNTGNGNTGDGNTGGCNTGDCNTGYYNTGYYNTGYYNTGHYNTGGFNTGHYNTGLFNKTNYSNGLFCTVEPKICIFNIQTDLTLSEFYNSKYYRAILSSNFMLTQWDSARNELIVYTYEEACEKWWANMDNKNKEIIKSIPNFNIDIFCEITGIDSSKV